MSTDSQRILNECSTIFLFEVKMSKQKTNRKRSKRSGPKTPEHPCDIAELAALVVGNLTSHGPGEEDATLIIFVWRDCAVTIKFPSGRKMCVSPGPGFTLDRAVHELAVAAISEYSEAGAFSVGEIRVHMVPSEARTSEQIFAWFQSIPGISVTVLPPEDIGFGGPLPPAGEAG
jgi:hypothetical protein